MPAKNRDLHGNAPDESGAALLLIDVINGFAYPGGRTLARHALPMARRLGAPKQRAGRAGIPAIYATTTLILTGLTADLCVFFTASDGFLRDFRIFVPRDCVASIDPGRRRDPCTAWPRCSTWTSARRRASISPRWRTDLPDGARVGRAESRELR